MIKYTAKDIIDRAEQLADLQNSDFISDSEKQHLLNEVWTAFYQKIINANDKAFIKTVPAFDGMALPKDMYQMGALYLAHNREQILKINPSQLDGYDIKNNTLKLSRNYDNREVILEYFPTPKTIIYNSGRREEKSFISNPKLIADYNFYVDDSNNLVNFDNDTVETQITGEGFLFKNGFLKVSDNSAVFTDFMGNEIETRETIPFVVKGNEVTFDMISSDDNLSDYLAYITDSNGEIIYFIGKNYKLYAMDFMELETLSGNECLYCRGDGLYIGNHGENKIRRYLGKVCETFPLSLMAFSSFVDDFYIIGKIGQKYYKTAYGFSTLLDYPNNIFFVVLAYALAVSFKIKQNGDPTLLSAKYEEATQQFFSSISRDDNASYTIKNVYGGGGYGY